jgi:cell pole-organizing protein PopZ
MSQSAKAQESSMEEILASIRRIISDDDTVKPSSPKPASAAATADLKNSRDLKNGQAESESELAGFDAAGDQESDRARRGAAEAISDVIELSEAMQAEASVFNGSDRSTAPEGARAMPVPDRPLLSQRATAAVDTAFSSLAHTVLMQNPRTLEDLVRDMLKPMLKAWLDDNLPNIVERLVRAEIERVSRGRG